MVALTAPRLTDERNPRTRRRPVAAATQIFGGSMVALNGVNLVPAAATAALKVLGVAVATVDNRLGAAGALSADFHNGCFRMDNEATDPLTAADIGAACYASDDHTVARTSASNARPQAGTVFDVDDLGVWVRF